MARSTYAPKDSYTGNGSVDTYTFDFKIESLSQLLIIEADNTGTETQRVRGTDVTYLSSVTFDEVEGGGTVVLAANLTNQYQLLILLANDAPTQPYELSNKTKFNLADIEAAFDWATGAIQRLAYRGKQALRLHDLDDEDTFNPQLPEGIADSENYDRTITINSDGTGFDYGPTGADILGATASAAAAATSAANAATSETNAATSETNAAASAVASAASAASAISNRFSFNTIVTGTVLTIPYNKQMVLVGQLDIQGTGQLSLGSNAEVALL